jgi:hypothetical protein
VVSFGGVLILMFLVHLIVHRGGARQFKEAASAEQEVKA